MNKPKSNYIDLGPLKEEVDGNMEVCAMLIKLFINDIKEYIHIMDTDLETNNMPTLYQTAHRIVSSVRIFGIRELEPIIIQLESDLNKEIDLESINKNRLASLSIFKQAKVELEYELNLIENAKE